MKKNIVLTAAAIAALTMPACSKKEEQKQEPAQIAEVQENSAQINDKAEDAIPEKTPAETQKEEVVPEANPFIQSDIDTSEAQAVLDSEAFKTKGLEAYYRDKTELTAAEFEALFIASQNDKVREDENFPVGSNALQAESVLWDHKSDPTIDTLSIFRKLMRHPSGTVRGMVLKQYDDTLCMTPDDLAIVAELIKTETDDFAISMALRALRKCLSTYPDAIAAAKKAAKSENPLLRAAAARSLAQTGNQIEDAQKIMLELLHDEVRDVRETACTYIGLFKNDDLIPEIMKIVLDPAQEDLHYSCTSSLFTMWYDYPAHQNTSDKAFEATLEVMRKLPECNKEPTWGTIEKMVFVNEETIQDWYTRSNFLGEKRDRYMAVMHDLALNTKLDYATRYAAINVMQHHAKEFIAPLTGELKKLKDQDSKKLLKKSNGLR